MSELNSKMIPAINVVDGFNPADFVRASKNEDGSADVYLDAKYRVLWFRLHHPDGKLDPEIVHLDDKSACVCCRVYANKADPPDQYIGKAYSHRFFTQDTFGDRFLEVAETIAKGRALADAGYGTQFCFSGDTDTQSFADAPIKLPPEDDTEQPLAAIHTQAPSSATPEAAKPVSQVSAPASEVAKPAAAARPSTPKTLSELIESMSVEDAKAVKVDVGRYAGRTLGEIAMIQPGDLAWYVKNYAGRNLALKAGATVLLNAVEKMAS